MNIETLKDRLSSADNIKTDPFSLLAAITDVLNKGNESGCRDVVLRALEHKEAFGIFQQILDSLVREVGLFPYLEEQQLSLSDTFAYEYHRPLALDEAIVFHREQAEIYRQLLNGNNVILSAPTSFGKSKIIDAIIASNRHKNIVVVVPTIALIDETRRRLMRFAPDFKIITQVSQIPSDKNIFIFTAERTVVYKLLPKIDFFVIDEFYKIGGLREDEKRTVALNHAFYKLSKSGGQFYLLGPCVREIPDGLKERFQCHFYKTNFATVASDEIQIESKGNDLSTLCELLAEIGDEPTLIFCKSPKSANTVVKAILEAGIGRSQEGAKDASKWMEEEFHPEWLLPRALRKGVGLHHGRLPRAISQYVVRAFNQGKISILACTSTLIEGVNTKAKNVIVFDNTIAKQKLDFFTFNNIRGRSGRMFEHFIGRVFLFHEPPEEDLPFVDFPFFTQTPDAPESILVQLEREDLSEDSRKRIEPFLSQRLIPIELIKRHSSIEPSNLIALAERLNNTTPEERNLLAWKGFPKQKNLELVCVLIWECIGPRKGQAGVVSGKQLSFKVSRLRQTPDIRKRILDELKPGKFAAESADDAVERVLEFDRSWASFELPRLLRAFSDVRNHIVGGPGDYAFFAGQLENLFRSPYQVALEEFGLPLQLCDKFERALTHANDIDHALGIIRELNPKSFHLGPFELELLDDYQSLYRHRK